MKIRPKELSIILNGPSSLAGRGKQNFHNGGAPSVSDVTISSALEIFRETAEDLTISLVSAFDNVDSN